MIYSEIKYGVCRKPLNRVGNKIVLMKTFLSKSGVLVTPENGMMSYFQSTEGYFLRFADPKEVEYLSQTLPRIQFEVGLESLENPQDLLWQHVTRCRAEATEEFPCEDFRVFARKWGRKLVFLKVGDENPTNPNDRSGYAILKLYGVQGEHEVRVWTGPSRFNDYVDGDFIAIEEVSESLEDVSLDWFGLFGHKTKLEAFKNIKKILGRSPGLGEVLSRPTKRRRK